MEERELLRRMGRGDTAALEEAMDRHMAFACGLAGSVLRGYPRDAEEVVSDAFLALWEHAGQIQPGRLRPWLGRVVRNKALNRLRALGGELPLEEDMLALTPDGAPGPAELLEQEQRRELVRALLDELSPQDRAIFLRHYYYGQTTAEIGQALSMRPSTVKVRLHRGRKNERNSYRKGGIPVHTRISDLLDGWEDGSAELPVPAGMSPERIREMTMKKVKESGRPRRRMGLRLLACAGLAAVFTVSAMAAYQLWGPGELFDPFFTIESAPLSDGQKALLDEIGTTDLPPVTSGGTTLTPLAAIADEHTLYLRLWLEAPEGTALPHMGEGEGHIAHDIHLVDTETGEQLNWGFQKARFLPDDTPGDNSLELVFMLLGFPRGANWIDGIPKTLTITGLELFASDGESMHLEGEWSFSLDGFYPSKAVEVDTTGAARWDETTERMVTLEGLTLSPLSAAFTTSYPTWGDEWGVFTNLEIELVFQDGSTVIIDGGNGGTSPGPDGDGGVVYFTGVHSFDTPLDLTQLAYIRFGEYRLELPDAPRQTVEVDTAGAVWHDEESQGTLALEALSFSSLSLDYRITYDNPEAVNLSDLGIRLVLADGSRVSVDCGTGFLTSDSIQGTAYFDAPVPLERVDHVLFGDIRLELPAAEP